MDRSTRSQSRHRSADRRSRAAVGINPDELDANGRVGRALRRRGRLSYDTRTTAEMMFADAVIMARNGERGDEVRAKLWSSAERAEGMGHSDLVARAWTLNAEIVGAGTHTAKEERQAREKAQAAIAQLADGDPLAVTLTRDLAYLTLARATSLVTTDSCTGDWSGTPGCLVAFDAVDQLTRLDQISGDARRDSDRFMLAEAKALTGDREAAKAAEGRSAVASLADEYLEPVAANAGSETELQAPWVDDAAAEQVRCNTTGSHCVVAPALVSALAKDPARLTRGARPVSALKDGVPRGYKLYGIKDGTLIGALGLRVGDLLITVDGAPVTALTWSPELIARLAAKDTLTVTLERGDEERTITYALR